MVMVDIICESPTQSTLCNAVCFELRKSKSEAYVINDRGTQVAIVLSSVQIIIVIIHHRPLTSRTLESFIITPLFGSTYVVQVIISAVDHLDHFLYTKKFYVYYTHCSCMHNIKSYQT